MFKAGILINFIFLVSFLSRKKNSKAFCVNDTYNTDELGLLCVMLYTHYCARYNS